MAEEIKADKPAHAFVKEWLVRLSDNARLAGRIESISPSHEYSLYVIHASLTSLVNSNQAELAYFLIRELFNIVEGKIPVHFTPLNIKSNIMLSRVNEFLAALAAVIRMFELLTPDSEEDSISPPSSNPSCPDT